MNKRLTFRQRALYTALLVAVALLVFDRLAAYLYLPAKDATEIVIYTTETCPYCRKLRAYLDEQKIPYTDRNIYKTASGIMGFWILRGRGVPVSTIGPDIIRGYDVRKIEQSLIKLGYKVDRAQHGNTLSTSAAKAAAPVN